METQKIRTPLAAILLLISVALKIFPSGLSLSLFSWLSLIPIIFLAILLLMKRHDSLLPLTIIIKVVIDLILGFNVFSFAAYITLLILMLCTCEQTIIKIDLSKLENICKNFFFIPAIMLGFSLLRHIMYLIKDWVEYEFPFYEDVSVIFSLISSFLMVVAFYFLASWLLDLHKSPRKMGFDASTVDELKKYKELLDTGAITQEEFDTKKKQLLDL